jgi:hypothetical protein
MRRSRRRTAVSERRRVASDPGVALFFNFAGGSPHVFAYKVWIKRPEDDDWTTCDCCEGDTQDDIPDTCDLGALPDATLLDIPVAVGGKKSSAYRGEIVFTQDGRVVHGGVISFADTTSEDGGGAEYIRVVLV